MDEVGGRSGRSACFWPAALSQKLQVKYRDFKVKKVKRVRG